MSYWALWGKTRQGAGEGDDTHALVHHMIEVGAVACGLWEGVVAEAVRGDLCRAIGVAPGEMPALLAWLASLHDLGKASPAFQAKYPKAIPELQAAGLHLGRQGQSATHHTAVGHCVLLQVLPRVLHAPARVVRLLAAVIGGHHGTWQSSPPEIPYWELGDEPWAGARRELVDALSALFQPCLPQCWPADQRTLNAFVTVLGGLVTVADWLGSMAEFFPCRKGPSDLPAYLQQAHRRARDVLERMLPGRVPADAEGPLFQRLFPRYRPNAVQRAAIQLGERLRRPALVIIEAPTGSGKTEAALYLAEHFRGRQAGAGTYIAMPTMTTSNQMHERVTAALAAAHPELKLQPLLVHGQAMWRTPPPAVAAEEDGGPDAVDSMAWFLPRKRSLLAPYGVGTVDQALLSVLRATHFYVRLYGLAHKTVVFDEVHAYDTYMSTLLERLLAWLHALGSSVVILSATLPAKTRLRLLGAFGSAEAMPDPRPRVYPAITWRSAGETGALALPAGNLSRQIELRGLDREGLLEDLRAALAAGGCAAVICNTVGRAQATYLALKEAGLVADEELYLFHARYPQAWRNEIEGRVLARFGKERRRRPSERAILVATQVVEQSLDLDFDYMISDLAPIDLLIQRAGRLQRHARRPEERPPGLRQATLTIIQPPVEAGVPRLGDDAPIYEPYVLLRTWLALEGRERLRTPADTSALIEAVYDESEPECGGRPELSRALASTRAEMQQSMRAAVEEAKLRLVAGPQSRYFVGGQAEVLHEDDPAVHRSLQALTRLAEPSVRVVCLHQHGEQLSVSPEGGPFLQPDRLNDELARTLAQGSVSVTHRGAVFTLLAQTAPPAWARHPFLRRCRLAVFSGGLCPLAGSRYTLRLTRELGLQVIKEAP